MTGNTSFKITFTAHIPKCKVKPKPNRVITIFMRNQKGTQFIIFPTKLFYNLPHC